MDVYVNSSRNAGALSGWNDECAVRLVGGSTRNLGAQERSDWVRLVSGRLHRVCGRVLLVVKLWR